MSPRATCTLSKNGVTLINSRNKSAAQKHYSDTESLGVNTFHFYGGAVTIVSEQYSLCAYGTCLYTTGIFIYVITYLRTLGSANSIKQWENVLPKTHASNHI
jgi:hypothetical protein